MHRQLHGFIAAQGAVLASYGITRGQCFKNTTDCPYMSFFIVRILFIVFIVFQW